MYSILYLFRIKINKRKEFINAWENLTTIIYNNKGSLGSRLHKKSDNEYIAYAQWPSEDMFDNAGDNLPKEAIAFREVMRKSCEKVEMLYKLEVVSDLLKEKQYE